MLFSSLPILLVFSIKSTFASPVGDDPNPDQNDATLVSNPVNLEQSTNQPSPNNDYPQSTSQLLATKLNPDTSFLEQTEDFVETPQQPYSDSSANMRTTVSPPRGVVPEKVSFRQTEPECTPPWWLYCCFGDEDYDQFGNRIIHGCFPWTEYCSRLSGNAYCCLGYNPWVFEGKICVAL